MTPAAASQPAILTFLAPGASNGFVWANSDRGLGSAPATNHLTRMTTTAINCSGQSTVLLTMKSTIGVFDIDADTACKVRVSLDGLNWTNFAPFPCLKAGDINPPCERFSYNPQNVAINISSVAANQPTVYLQFQWRGGWEYYWAIDDLELSPLPPNELTMVSGYSSQFGGGYEYGRVPASQMQSTLNVGAQVINFGSNDQTNVVVNVSLTDAGGATVGTTTTNVGTLLYGDTITTDEEMALPSPMPTGIYTAHFTMTSDSIAIDDNPNNNTKYRSFAVTDNLYSLDGIGVYPDSVQTGTQTGTSSFADNTQDVRFLNYYEIHAPMTFTGVEIALGANTRVGSYFVVSVYDTIDVLATPADLTASLMESNIRVITAQDSIDNKASVAFLDPLPLGVGAYFVSANLYQEGGNDIYIIDDTTVPQPNIASMLWIPVDDQQQQFLYGGNGTAWAVRLTSDPNVSVREATQLEGVSIYPNPTAGLLHVNSSKAEPLTVEVRNVLGQIVKSAVFNGMSNTVDLSGNTAGIYTVRVGNGTSFTVKRIALK